MITRSNIVKINNVRQPSEVSDEDLDDDVEFFEIDKYRSDVVSPTFKMSGLEVKSYMKTQTTQKMIDPIQQDDP